MSYSQLGKDEHVVRNVSKQRWREVSGKKIVFQQAFALRKKEQLKPPNNKRDEASLSCSWVEFFSGGLEDQVNSCRKALLTGGLIIGAHNALAVCNVGKLEKCGETHDVKIRALHKPNKNNTSKAGIDGMTVKTQTDQLLMDITEIAVVEVFKVGELE